MKKQRRRRRTSYKSQQWTKLWLPYPLYRLLRDECYEPEHDWADRIFTVAFTLVGTIVCLVGLKVILTN